MILKHVRTFLSPFQFRSNSQKSLLTLLFLLLLYGNADSGSKKSANLGESIKRDRNFRLNNYVDIVGYGEDCSVEDGLLCNEAQHLICDPEEETCICDALGGYVHFTEVENGYYRHSSSKQVCLRPVPEEDEETETTQNQNVEENLKPKSPKSLRTEVNEEDEYEYDPDIVQFGEDCSPEGPFCDNSNHLMCDPVEETCVCNLLAGYLHIDNVPGAREQHLMDGNGKSVCVSTNDVAEKAEKLLGIMKHTDRATLARQAKALDMHLDLDDFFGAESIPEDEERESTQEKVDVPGGSNPSLGGIYKNFMDALHADQDEEWLFSRESRLAPFKLDRNFDYSGYDESAIMKELSVEEIMKFGKGKWDFPEIKGLMNEFSELYFGWMENRLAKQVCGMVFDADQDGIITQQEYAIVVLSEKIRRLTMPKAFHKLIRSWTEETCIGIEDLQALDHDATTIYKDFRTLDVDNDDCFSYPEFESAMDEICHVNWLDKVLKGAGLHSLIEGLDPSPEEMHVRRIMQTERLSSNWKAVDKDGDKYISRDELQSDLIGLGHASDDSYEETDSLLRNMDYNEDGKISLSEAASTISVPLLTEEYQYEWLESLYELYETDDEEVQENLEAILNDESLLTPAPAREDDPELRRLRIFTMFDKNRNGEIDQVEFRMLLEMMKKYVVHGILNETLASVDTNRDNKLSVLEFQFFFNNASSKFQRYLRGLLISVLENDDNIGVATSDDNDNDTGEEEADDGNIYETEDEDGNRALSWRRLSWKGAKANETLILNGLFMRLDVNSDGFLTKDDLYALALATSYQTRLSDYELKKEFDVLDSDSDGVLTVKDSEEFVIPVTFDVYKDNAHLSEDVFHTDFENQLKLMDTNKDGILQMSEYLMNRDLLFADEEEEVVGWIEFYFAQSSSQMEPGGEKAFGEFDENCDGFITATEFSKRLNRMIKNAQEDTSYTNLAGDFTKYFDQLDLNKDKKVSYNEFHFLLLRNNKRIDEK